MLNNHGEVKQHFFWRDSTRYNMCRFESQTSRWILYTGMRCNWFSASDIELALTDRDRKEQRRKDSASVASNVIKICGCWYGLEIIWSASGGSRSWKWIVTCFSDRNLSKCLLIQYPKSLDLKAIFGGGHGSMSRYRFRASLCSNEVLRRGDSLVFHQVLWYDATLVRINNVITKM